MSKGQYVCQRAAHAIIAEIGPLRVSSDALGAINLFIDEFLALLIISASSLDLVRLKTAVVQLLPQSLGKNALVEAEIELKHQVESEHHDFTSYEKMRSLVNQDGIFPVDQVIPLVQSACAAYCTLASDDNQSMRSLCTKKTDNIIIAPVVVIYVTTIVEHIAEYVLNSVAMTADQVDAEHIRVKEVLLALLDDPQVSMLFRRMNLKDKLEKRASVYQPSYNNNYVSLPTPQLSPISVKRDSMIQRNNHASSVHSTIHHKEDPDINFNEGLNDSEEESVTSPRGTTITTISSNSSMRSSESINDRPLSIMSNGTTKSSGSKSRFNFFGNKDKRNSISLNFTKRSTTIPSSSTLTSPTKPSFQRQSMTSPISMDFDDLIRSGGTKKVSLTPNRLKSIEVKEEATVDVVTPWDRKNSTRTKKRAPLTPTDTTPPPPLPPLSRLNRDSLHQSILSPTTTTNNNDSSPPLTPASSVASRPSQRSRHSIIYEEKSTPTSRSSMKSYSTNEDLSSAATTEENISNHLMRNPSKMSTSSSLYSSESNKSNNTNNKPRMIERPSSMVVKRASMGSRPPSFHENVLMTVEGQNILVAAAAAGSVVVDGHHFEIASPPNNNNRKSVMMKKLASSLAISSVATEDRDEHQQQQPDMIYLMPATTTIPNRPSPIITSTTTSKTTAPRTTAKTMDTGCQTDPIALHTLIHQHHIEEDEDEDDERQHTTEEEEEWFIEEEEWEDHAEEEKLVAEWLLGNV